MIDYEIKVWLIGTTEAIQRLKGKIEAIIQEEVNNDQIAEYEITGEDA